MEAFTVLRTLSYEVPNTAKTEDIIACVINTIHEYDQGLSPDTRPIVELYQVRELSNLQHISILTLVFTTARTGATTFSQELDVTQTG